MIKEDYIDTTEFSEEGYLVIPPEVVFSKNEIDELGKEFDKTVFDYKDGEVDPTKNNSREDPRFNHSHKIGNIRLFGCAIRHMFFRGHGSVDTSLDDNYLYGKRGVLMELDFSPKTKQFVENKKIVNLAKKYLELTIFRFITAVSLQYIQAVEEKLKNFI